MAADADRYDAWYSEKLWTLLPALYRAEDSPEFDRRGPLRELVDRIGAQAAIVRRSVDRLWEDQSIESCDDWVIDYIGDLLATNLVASLDARGRRVDVGKTIYYRRRKGTVGLLEELATDITGWSVRVVEFFHLLARTRHGLDPAIGLPALPTDPRGRLQRAQRLVGAQTRTAAGGFADLRNVHGANLAGTAFDEFFHTADMRRGRGTTGWHNIPHLGVFVWRLKSFAVQQITPVQDATCTNQYTFDPTGRDIPLYAADDHPFRDRWISPQEHQVPGPITADLLHAAFVHLYRDDAPRSIGVHRWVGGASPYLFVPPAEVSQDPRVSTGRFAIDPVRGRIIASAGAPAAPPAAADGLYRVDYHYGFSSEIGAGPYDRRVQRNAATAATSPATAPAPVHVAGGADRLEQALQTLGPTASVVIDDSLTYTAVANLTAIRSAALRAKNLSRPLVRPAATTAWVFTGANDAVLLLDGIFLSGAHLVLRGSFDSVALSCCTLDPGTWNPAGNDWATAADSRPLAATELRIEGTVRRLVIDRCITGPISDNAGVVESVTATDSIIQAAAPEADAMALATGEVALSRCTILGTLRAHRLSASECILHDVATVDDTQHGCVRFSAWAPGSVLPRQYESVKLTARADVFVGRDFGRPEFAQLLATTSGDITEGAEDGSEMGAFAREKSRIKERSLLIKYQEYLPLGLEPVIVHVT
jgi:hypothetical protein